MTLGGGSDGPRALPLPGGGSLGLRSFGPWQSLLLGIALLLGGFGGYIGFTKFYESSHQAPQVGNPVRVVRTTIRNTVSATGTVTATEQSNLVFQVTGQIVDIFIKPGDVLQQGQPIAALDSRSSTIARDVARSSLGTAQAKLDALLAGATPDVVAAAQSTLTQAQNSLTNLLNGALPTDIETVQAGLDKANADLRIAQSNYDKLVSHSDLATRTEVTALATAKQNFETAQVNYLAKLTPPLSTDVAQSQTNLKLARDVYQVAQLRNLQVQADPTSSNSDKLAAQNAVGSAQANVDSAQSNIQKLRQGTDQSSISAAQAQVDNSRVALEAAQTNYNNLVALSDLVGRPEFSALSTARSALQTAKAAYDAKLAPAQPTDVGTGRATVQAAAAKLAQTVGPPLPTDVIQATEAVTSAQLAVQQAQLALDNQTLRAPFSGTVVSAPAHIGDQVGATTTITTLVNPNALEVDANVDETSVTQLKAGQPATVTLDALPGKTFNAMVSAVTPSGTTQQGVVVFPIVFRLDTQGQTVPAGASANITVVTAVTPNVLAVPARYVHRQGANQVVDVLENNKRVSKAVTTGVTNGQLTEITGGLQAGDVAIPAEQNRAGQTFGAGGNVGGGPPSP